MLATRIIPVLLLQGKGLVKTLRFKKPVYVGDPINAVKVFNDKEVDELIFLDINASKKGIQPDYQLIGNIASECFMPVCYGGGIKSTEEAKKILGLGIEKISLNTAALNHPSVIEKSAALFGSQSVVVTIDVRRKMNGSRKVYSHVSGRNIHTDPVDYAKSVEAMGAGEIMINSVDRDGTMSGFDKDIVREIAAEINIPVIACGGAGNLMHMKELRNAADVGAIAAGSMFVFHGKHKAVLLSYPSQEELKEYLN